MNGQKLKALYAEDLKEFLASIDQLAEIEAGHIFCEECGALITLSNIQLVIPRGNGIYGFVCSSPQCTRTYYEKGGQ